MALVMEMDYVALAMERDYVVPVMEMEYCGISDETVVWDTGDGGFCHWWWKWRS